MSSVLCFSLKGIRSLKISLPKLSAGMVHQRAVSTYLHQPYLETLMQAILFGLGGPVFARNLVDLQLTLPATKNIAEVLSAIAEVNSDALKRLQHLCIVVVDFSNTRVNDAGVDIPSNLQARFPNFRHQDEVWEQLVKFPNLESLMIHASDCLDFFRLSNRLEVAPEATFTRLRVLDLTSLLSNSTRISKITRHAVSLLGIPYDEPDTWGDVFRYMRRYCRVLEFVYVKDLCYSCMHPLYLRPEPVARGITIWSTCLNSTEALYTLSGNNALPFTDDHAALHLLVKWVADRLGGPAFYPGWLVLQNPAYDVHERPTSNSDDRLGIDDKIALVRARFDMGELRMWPTSRMKIIKRKKSAKEDKEHEEDEDDEEDEENEEDEDEDDEDSLVVDEAGGDKNEKN
ncbi:uncharacterized protein PgNI_08495 [Pyricularia grisea]|uniref:Uncharacterized protein n=1 Tax=Pyricularia grisea TaxID=148305 RepID=A0A6P8AVQ1_PYRGI|nr:uncharacterized protein PgNI_08495 [Pyricularia grisea]TLD06249.1 hypothetical protein PgNI_08495 [Pyricularia grisea]